MDEEVNNSNWESLEIQCRKMLLDMYSSHLSTHARLLIGFAVMLLTIFEIKIGLKSITILQSNILYVAVFLATLAWWFLFMRHFSYGLMVNASIHAPPSDKGESCFDKIRNGIRDSAYKENILGFIPNCLYFTSGGKNRGQRIAGFLLCVAFTIGTTFFVWLVLG